MAGQMSNASEVRRADQSMSHDATLKSLQESYSPRSTAVVHAHAKNRPRPLWVIRYRSLRDEDRSMSAMPRKRRLAVKASLVAMGQDRTRASQPTCVQTHCRAGTLMREMLAWRGVCCRQQRSAARRSFRGGSHVRTLQAWFHSRRYRPGHSRCSWTVLLNPDGTGPTRRWRCEGTG